MSTNIMKQTPAKTSTIRVALLALGIVLILLLIIGRIVTQNREAPVEIPADFQPAAVIDLSTRAYENETVAELVVTETAVVGLHLAIPNIDTPYFDLSLLTPNGDSLTVLHSENYRTDQQGSGYWEQSLPAGTYQLVLTAPQSSGSLSIYWGYP